MQHADFCSAMSQRMVSGKEDIHCKERHEKSVIKLSFILRVMELQRLDPTKLEIILGSYQGKVPPVKNWGELVGIRRDQVVQLGNNGGLWRIEGIEREEYIVLVHKDAIESYLKKEIRERRECEIRYAIDAWLFMEPAFSMWIAETQTEEYGKRYENQTIMCFRGRNKRRDLKLAKRNIRKEYYRLF